MYISKKVSDLRLVMVKVLRALFVSFLLICTLVVSLTIYIRFFFPHISVYRTAIEHWISLKVEDPVHIGHIAAHWEGLRPVLVIHDFTIASPEGKSLMNIKKVRVGVDVLASLWKWRIEPGDLFVEDTHLILQEQEEGIVSINGVPAFQADLNSNHSEKLMMLIEWFLAKGVKELKNVNITWQGKDGSKIPISQLQVHGHSGFYSHILQGQAQFGSSSSLVHFTTRLHGSVFARKWVHAHLDVRAQNVRLTDNALLQIAADYGFKIEKGNADIQIRLRWKPEQVTQLVTQFHARDVVLESNKQKKYHLNTLAGHLALQNSKRGWLLSFDQLNLQLNNKTLPIKSGSIQQQNEHWGTGGTRTLRLDNLPIQDIAELLGKNHVLPAKISEILKQTQPTGEIHNFVFVTKGDNLKQFNAFSLSGDLHQVSFLPWKKVPGVRNLSGKIKFTPQHGEFQADSQALTLDYRKIFRQPIAIQSLQAKVDWRHYSGHWRVQVEQGTVATSDGSAKGAMNIILPDDGSSPQVNSQASFTVSDARDGSRYFPVAIMPKQVIDWLDNAIKQGQVSSGNFILKGRLCDFPFDRQQGQFLVDAHIENGALHYLSGWPDIENISGNLRFAGRSMTVTANSATSLGAKINNVTAIIPDLGQVRLGIQGKLSLNSQDKITLSAQNNFIQSLLNQQIGTMNLQGDVQLALKLAIPLDKRILEGIKLEGSANFQGLNVAVPRWHFNAGKLKGNLEFTEDSVKSTGIQGEVLQQPFQLTATTQKSDGVNLTRMNMKGHVLISNLQKILNLKLLENLQGGTDYQSLITFYKKKNSFYSSINWLSDLNGIEVKLPIPFGKSKDVKIPTKITVTTVTHVTPQPLKVSFSYGSRVNGILGYRQNAHGTQFDRGEIHFGDKSVKLPSTSGLAISGVLPEFDWDAWQNIFPNKDNASASLNLGKLKNTLHNIDLNIAKLNIKGYKIPFAKLQVNSAFYGWRIWVSSPVIQGQIQIPRAFPHAAIKANLQRLDLSGEQNFHQQIKPDDVLPLDLDIASFHYKDREMKQVQLKVQPEGKNLLIKHIAVNEPLFQLRASGIWRNISGKQETVLAGELKSKNIGAALNQWKVTDNVVLGRGKTSFNLSWQGSPMAPEAKSLNGRVELYFNEGRIIKLGTQAAVGMGFGRVLTLFSLQTLPRRLMLDFSDLTESGFSFDEMKGTFSFKQGNAFTENAYLDGPVAKVRSNGRIGLNSKDYDLRLLITPNVTSSLPVVATITAGPIAGAVTWLVDKFLGRQVNKITQIHYHVTGSWDRPHVTNLP
jgi:uncharacterized protein (TIGR02099 family)